MTNRITTPPKARTVIVGVDTHKHVHVAVAIDSWGIRLGDHAFVADSGGYEALVTWAETHGRIEAFGIEGTGSYGAGLARAVHRAGHHVVEVNRGDRRTRRAAGKSDTIDAEEIALHDQHLARLTTATSPTLCEGFGVGAHTAAELLIIFGDNPDRIRSEAAFAKLCGACPIPASSGMTTGRHRLNRGGHRHANAALYRAVIVRMQFHQPTRDYVARRIAAGRTKRDIIRCLKRFLAREIYQRVMTDFRARQEIMRIPDDREHRFQSNVHTDSGHVEQRFQDGEHGFRGTCTLVGSEVRQAASSKGRTQPCRHRDYR